MGYRTEINHSVIRSFNQCTFAGPSLSFLVKHAIHQLNKAFDHRVRLGVMAVLMANEEVSFGDLKETLDLTDGNLASHAAALEKAGYIQVNKQFIGKKPNTTFTATKDGRQAFQDHLDTLEKLLRRGG